MRREFEGEYDECVLIISQALERGVPEEPEPEEDVEEVTTIAEPYYWEEGGDTNPSTLALGARKRKCCPVCTFDSLVTINPRQIP
jgi:hypothetical protein